MTDKILVTGASGFIGGRIVRALAQEGRAVKALVRASSGRGFLRGLPAGSVEVVEGDVMVEHTVYRALAGCDRLFHVAALTKFWDRDPRAIEATAIDGTRAVFEAARRRGLRRAVYTSSIAVLGVSPTPEPLDETSVFSVADPDAYLRAKVRAEEEALSYLEHFDVVPVLPAIVCGPGDVRPAPGGQGILRFLAWDGPLIDFPCIAGGINVVDGDDVARGHVLAMDKGRAGERYVLGGADLTYEEFYTTLAEVTGLPGPGRPVSKGLAELVGRLSELRARLGGPEPEFTYRMARDYVGAYTYVSSAKAERELGYTHRPVREALTRAVLWFLEHGYVAPEDRRRIRLDTSGSV